MEECAEHSAVVSEVSSSLASSTQSIAVWLAGHQPHAET